MKGAYVESYISGWEQSQEAFKRIVESLWRAITAASTLTQIIYAIESSLRTTLLTVRSQLKQVEGMRAEITIGKYGMRVFLIHSAFQ
jgi:hypothetical protein